MSISTPDATTGAAVRPLTQEEFVSGFDQALQKLHEQHGSPTGGRPASISNSVGNQSSTNLFQAIPCASTVKPSVITTYSPSLNRGIAVLPPAAANAQKVTAASVINGMQMVKSNNVSVLVAPSVGCDGQGAARVAGNGIAVRYQQPQPRSAAVTGLVPTADDGPKALKRCVLTNGVAGNFDYSTDVDEGPSPVKFRLLSVDAATVQPDRERGFQRAVSAPDPSNQVCHELPLHVAMANDDQIMGSESSHDQPTRPQRQQRHQPSPQKQADQHLPQTETAATTDIIDPKKLRNRAAASKCRKKKLQRMEEMRKETDEKVAENEKLAKQVKNLQSQLSHMRHLLATHRNNGQCRILVQSTSRSDGV